MTRILLVDDHPVVRQGIKQVLADAFHPALMRATHPPACRREAVVARHGGNTCGVGDLRPPRRLPCARRE